MKFEEYVKLTEEEHVNSYVLNEEGKIVIKKYNEFIESLKLWIEPNNVVALISRIDTDNIGNIAFKVAKRLATITNNGENPIDAKQYTIADNDPMMRFLDKQ